MGSDHKDSLPPKPEVKHENEMDTSLDFSIISASPGQVLNAETELERMFGDGSPKKEEEIRSSGQDLARKT
jgi:hypothetical protein